MTGRGCCGLSPGWSRSTARSYPASSRRTSAKPIAGARGEIGMVAQVFHFYAGAVDKHLGETIPVAGGVAATFREALGVVGLIVPWNFPLNIASWKLGPALACGNTVVLKPAELTPLSALRLARARARGRNPGGRPQRRRRARARSSGSGSSSIPTWPRSRFTGSTEVGREVMRGAAGDDQARHARAGRQVGERDLRGRRSRASRRRGSVRRSSTTPARTAARARGSSCSAPSTTASSSSWSRRPAGSRSETRPEERTEMGPLISAAHRETVASFVEGEPLFRGDAPDGPGYWFPVHARARRRTTTASPARRSSAPWPR